MWYVLAGLGSIALAEGALLWYVWTRLRAAQRDAAVADTVMAGYSEQLVTVYNDLVAARAVLAQRNAEEHKADEKVVQDNPGLDSALDRINGL